MRKCGQNVKKRQKKTSAGKSTQRRKENNSPAYSRTSTLFEKCTPHNAVIDGKGPPSSDAWVRKAWDYSVKNEHASTRESTVRHMHTPFGAMVAHLRQPGCETRARTRRMRDPCWNATQQLVFEFAHLFFGAVRSMPNTHFFYTWKSSKN